MVRENFDVEVPDGTHLGFSRDTGGAYRAHLFEDGTNQLVGHAELFEPGLDDSVSAQETVYVYFNGDQSTSQAEGAGEAAAMAALAVLGIIVAARKAAPHVTKWWNGKALPFLRDKRAKLSRSAKERSEFAVVETLPSTDSSSEVPDDVFTALDEYRASMSSAEARERFIAALVARLFSEKQLRLLRNARIEDGNGSLELASAIEVLTPQQLEDGIRSMLEANPSWPDQETVAELGKLLNGVLEDREALPLRVDRKGGQGKHRRAE